MEKKSHKWVWNLMTPDEEQRRASELTKNRFEPVGDKFLAYYRVFLMIYFIGHNIFVIIATYEVFWMFLTNLAHIVCMITYIMLVVLHCKKGDFRKQKVKNGQVAEN